MLFGRKVSSTMTGYNFTEELRRVLSAARGEATRLRHEYVGTEHVLLALSDDAEGGGAAVMRELRVQPTDVRTRLEDIVKKGTTPVPGDRVLPYTSRAKKVLELSMTAARNL